jgi:Ni,Fe-hydrogenase III large subunit
LDPTTQHEAAQGNPERPVTWTRNGVAVPVDEIANLGASAWRNACVGACTDGARIASLVGLRASKAEISVLAVLVDDGQGKVGLCRTRLERDPISHSFAMQSLTPELPEAQAFERALLEDYGVHPIGHPWPKPLRRHDSLERRAGRSDVAAPHPFFEVRGEGIHEVAVGPVHAGVIEPGHFRFQCDGETVLHLEIQLGYQSRGAEALFLRSSAARRLLLAECIAGDTSVGHATAYCMNEEALAGTDVPLSGLALRGIALELERLANHTGDLGALCGDVGYLPGAAYFGRLRGEFLNVTMALSGSRMGRGFVIPGGVRFNVPPADRALLIERITRAERDLRDSADLALESSAVAARFEETGKIPQQVAEELGLVGPVARASECDRDVRRDHPRGIYRFAHVPTAIAPGGDVMARALVRWVEIQRSLTFVKEQIASRLESPVVEPVRERTPRSVCVSLVEGWRGEIAHVAVTDDSGDYAAYRIVDPSFHNWFGLTMALRDCPISDFPLCNKSFNLSYAGHDL